MITFDTCVHPGTHTPQDAGEFRHPSKFPHASFQSLSPPLREGWLLFEWIVFLKKNQLSEILFFRENNCIVVFVISNHLLPNCMVFVVIYTRAFALCYLGQCLGSDGLG